MDWVYMNNLARDADAIREFTRLLHEFKHFPGKLEEYIYL